MLNRRSLLGWLMAAPALPMLAAKAGSLEATPVAPSVPGPDDPAMPWWEPWEVGRDGVTCVTYTYGPDGLEASVVRFDGAANRETTTGYVRPWNGDWKVDCVRIVQFIRAPGHPSA